MEFYKYLQEVLEFRVYMQAELNGEDQADMCSHFGISPEKLEDMLKNNKRLFKYRIRDKFSGVRYVTLIPYNECSITYTRFDAMEYLGLKIIFNKESGFVNVTHLCNQQKVRFRDWFKLGTSQMLIRDLEKEFNTRLHMFIDADVSDHRGTYVHECLVIYIASWISNVFAFKVARIITDYDRTCRGSC